MIVVAVVAAVTIAVMIVGAADGISVIVMIVVAVETAVMIAAMTVGAADGTSVTAMIVVAVATAAVAMIAVTIAVAEDSAETVAATGTKI